MHLNPPCPEHRRVANSNQARFHCPFAISIRRSSMPGLREFRNIKFRFFNLKRDTIPELGGAQPKKPFHPSLNSLWEQPIHHDLRSGDYGFCLKV